jgi:alpha-galactosidase
MTAPARPVTAPLSPITGGLAEGVWCLSTPNSSYVLAVAADGRVVQLHWGARLAPGDGFRLDEAAAVPPYQLPLESQEPLPVDGGLRWGPPSLQIAFPGGVRSLELSLVDDVVAAEPGAHRLDLVLADTVFPLQVVLHYRVREDSDVIERWVTLRHTADRGEPLQILRADSGNWLMPRLGDYRYSVVSGGYHAEGQLRRGRLPDGEYRLTSRTGISSHHANPWMMIDDGTATEAHGPVWSVALAWSGSWRLTAYRQFQGRAAVSAGFGHDGLSWPLDPGAELTTPPILGLYTSDGFGATSRGWHQYARAHVLPHPGEDRPVLYNSWEAVEFDLDESAQLDLARRATDLGVELFVIDDGWFSSRTSDRSGLGDWWPNPDRFPNGLITVARHVHELGMRFGIWVEPEAVNSDSELYRAHPDWVLHFPNRRRDELRRQLVLNFARVDVRAWALDWLDRLVTDNHVDYLKWDMNRGFSQAGWPERGDAQDWLWIDHTRGVYQVIDQLRARHPALRIESCAGGGGRLDYGILARTDQVWPSDNTDAYHRQSIQHGLSQLYPATVMSAWVTDKPYSRDEQRNEYAYHVAMAGVLGIGGNLNAWTDTQHAQARRNIALYKQIRATVQRGEQYRLGDPPGAGLTGLQYVLGDETVVFVYRPRAEVMPGPDTLRLAGLDPDAIYTNPDTATVVSGRALTSAGLPVGEQLPAGDWASAVIRLRRRPADTC